MTTTPTGIILAQLKTRTGLTWAQLADTIGASSGDYVRKVATGAKPGHNLTTVVRELMGTGQVAHAVPRRRTAAGKIARVRAAAATGAPSRRPSQTAVPPPAGTRRLFATPQGGTGWAQSVDVTADTTDAAAFTAAVRAAGRGRRRVTFRVQVRPKPGAPGQWVIIGEKGGYTPADVARQVKAAGSVDAWVATQLRGRTYTGAGHLIAVEIMAA